MFFLETSGSPYEMGLQAGRASRLAIAQVLDLTARGLHGWDDKKFEAAREQQMAFTEKLCPELVEEVRGFADGSGFPFKLVYFASFFSQMLLYNEECSNIAFASSEDGPLLAKTNDLPAREGSHSMVKLKRPEKGYAVLGIGWAGTVWNGAGINEAGLAVGGSSCNVNVPAPEEYAPRNLLSHYILSRAGSVREALDMMRDINIPPRGVNLVLADSSGGAAAVEKAGALMFVRHPSDGAVFCTNHPVSEEMMSRGMLNERKLQGSIERYEAITRLSSVKPRGVELIKSIVAYNGKPGALCRYGYDDPNGSNTECAILCYPAGGKMEACFSHADRDPWFEFSL